MVSRFLRIAGIFLVLITPACAGMKDSRRAAPEVPVAGLTNQTIHIDGQQRRFKLFLPSGAGKNLPLVIALHGGGGNAQTMVERTGFVDLAKEEKIVVAFPEGTGRGEGRYTWNAGGCCAYAMQQSTDDVTFIRKLIDEAVEQYGVDPERIYLVGMSNGGMVSHRIAAAMPERIAGIGIVVGAMFGGETPPALPVSAILINGRQDAVVPYDGGKSPTALVARSQSRPFAPASYTAAFWADVNDCGAPVSTRPEPDVSLQIYEDCSAGTSVHFYTLERAGHGWPGAEPVARRRQQSPTQDFETTATIWRFLKSKSR